MPQPSLDLRRARRAAMTGTRERLVSEQLRAAAIIDQRIADQAGTETLGLRERQLELLRLQAG